MPPVVVTSVPLSGPMGRAPADAAAAAQQALEDAGADVEHRVLDPGDEPEQDARAAVADPDVVAYLGEWHSAATVRSLPVLEAAGLPHVSFVNTFRCLFGASFFNVMPNDEAQAADLVGWMLESGIDRPFLLNWDEPHGLDMRLLVHREWAAAGRRVAGGASFLDDPRPHVDGADAVFLGAVAEPEVARALAELHERAPDALLFGMDGLNVADFVADLPATARARLRIESAALHGDRLPAAGHELLRRLGERLGHAPDAHAVYAYEAMALVLDALVEAGPDRAALTERLRATRGRDSVLGRYDLDERGQTTLGTGGRLVVEGHRLVPA